MAEYIESLRLLAEQFARLEGVGKKSAMRMAFSILELNEEEAKAFSQAILDAKEKIHFCPICQNLTDRDVCPICADENRDRSLICVVSDARTVLAMEKVREYRGTYHVLHGLISPMNGVTPDQLKIKELLARVNDPENPVDEIIVATNPTVEGEATAMYLSRLLKPLGVQVTRLAYGVPVGADLEYADEITLFRALEGRREV
ncbi:MAG: recombination protein RecR [Clostridia bacterium]|nr:recombination protein RecR [Clostridia bacterium]MBQ5833286.1 recombination protein RecR [Clostridia bacterium]